MERLRLKLQREEDQVARTRMRLAAHEARLQQVHRAAAVRLQRQARNDALRDMRGAL